MTGALSLWAAFLRRDWALARSYRFAFVLESAGALFTLALFFYLSRLVDPDRLATGAADGYFAFVVVGIALFAVLGTAVRGFTARLREEQTTATLEAVLSSPVPLRQAILGGMAYDLLRGAASGLAMFVLAAAVFGFAPRGGADAAAVAGLGLVVWLALIVALNIVLAAAILVVKRVAGVVGLATTALILLSGAYFPTDLLPAVLEAVAESLPFSWVVDAIRGALLEDRLLGERLAAAAGVAAIAVPAALGLLAVAVRRVKRTGGLAEY